MSIKEQIIDALLPHCDMFTSCEEADRIIADAKQGKPGEKRTYYLVGTTTAITLQKNKPTHCPAG